MRINLTDNNGGNFNEQVFIRSEVAKLFPIADKRLEELCEENHNILIFPHSIGMSIDKIEESSIISIVNTDNPDIVMIKTGNIMGFFGVGNIQVKIKSRFDDGRDDFLLHYMLQRVLSFNIFDLNHSNEQEDVLDLMMFMFPYFLKSAMRQGLYREYQRYVHNDSNVRGKVDTNRHLRQNSLFNGNIAYSTREYSYDNNMTELIRHAIEFMRSKRYGRAILDIDNETSENVSSIIEHTQSYSKAERSRVIQNNLRGKVHPYYTEYKPLQSLCIQILRMEEVKYGESDDNIYGILFDGAWLWEEYINTILSNQGFLHPENKIGKGAIYLFKDIEDGKIYNRGRRFPDFYRNDFVLDAKYKRLGSYDKVSQVDRDDIHQVMAYMTALKAKRGGFISPLDVKPIKPPTSHIKDTDSTISIFGVEISKENRSYKDFCEAMRAREEDFINSLCDKV